MKGQFPWIGRSRGSAGGMTTAKINDKNVMRAKAFEVSNPNTQAQQTQRKFFTELTELNCTFTEEQLRTLFPNKPKTMTRRNALSKQLAKSYNVAGTTKSIDYSDIDTLGNAPTMDMGTTTCVITSNSIGVVLDDKVIEDEDLSPYLFITAFVNETKGKIQLSTICDAVASGGYEINLPTGWESTDTVHAIPLITNVKNSENIGDFGSFIIKTRPEKVSH